MSNTSQEPPWVRDWEEVRCALTVFSDTVTAAEVTAHVGVEPTNQMVKGEPRRGRPNMVVASHQWTWEPGETVAHTLDAQLDAIWDALGSRADAFKGLPAEASVGVDVWIVHRGRELSLGWVLDRRHVSHAAAFGALIDIDEYDATDEDEA